MLFFFTLPDFTNLDCLFLMASLLSTDPATHQPNMITISGASSHFLLWAHVAKCIRVATHMYTHTEHKTGLCQWDYLTARNDVLSASCCVMWIYLSFWICPIGIGRGHLPALCFSHSFLLGTGTQISLLDKACDLILYAMIRSCNIVYCFHKGCLYAAVHFQNTTTVWFLFCFKIPVHRWSCQHTLGWTREDEHHCMMVSMKG